LSLSLPLAQGTPCDALLVRSVGVLHRLAELGGPGAQVRINRGSSSSSSSSSTTSTSRGSDCVSGTDLLEPVVCDAAKSNGDGADDGDVEEISGGRGARISGNKLLTIPPLYGDFSLNAANSVAAATLVRVLCRCRGSHTTHPSCSAFIGHGKLMFLESQVPAKTQLVSCAAFLCFFLEKVIPSASFLFGALGMARSLRFAQEFLFAPIKTTHMLHIQLRPAM
jgi:hypothetical protein